MEMLELISPEVGHVSTDENCPFCKDEEKKTDLKTYPGKDNHSSTLAANMAAGTNGRRQKDRNCLKHEPVDKKPKPQFIVGGAPFKSYSFQAHHAISGNQAMKDQPVEKWICKDRGEIAADTGYSINNSSNGVWLPSKPNRKSWDKDFPDSADRRRIAYFAMRERAAQWHLGHHAIVTPGESDILESREARKAFEESLSSWDVVENDMSPSGDEDDEETQTDDADACPAEKGTYDAWLKEQLGLIDDHIANACRPKCHNKDTGDDGTPYMNTVVHVLLDRLSAITQNALTNPHVWRKWNRFISLLAWEYTLLSESSRAAQDEGEEPGTQEHSVEGTRRL